MRAEGMENILLNGPVMFFGTECVLDHCEKLTITTDVFPYLELQFVKGPFSVLICGLWLRSYTFIYHRVGSGVPPVT